MNSFSNKSTSDDVVLNGEEKQEPSLVTERIIEKQQQQSTEGGSNDELAIEGDVEEQQHEASLDDSLNVADAFGISFMLFNNSVSYSGFEFSKECKKELHRRGLLNTNYNDDYLSNCVTEPLRSHPVVLQIFDEMGSEWCSGDDSKIEKEIIPAGFSKWAKVIGCEGGSEFIRVDFDKAYADSLDDLLDRPDATVEEVRSMRDKFDDFRRGNWPKEIKTKIGERLLARRICPRMIKSRMGELMFDAGLEDASDMPTSLVRLVSSPKRLGAALTRAEDAVGRLAEKVRDVVVQSFTSVALIDLWKGPDEYLDNMFAWAELAVKLEAKDLFRDLEEKIGKRLIWPIIQPHAPLLADQTVSELIRLNRLEE
jgi:hypothetical protein